MPPTAAERRAKIRARLREADEPPGTVEETTNTFTEEVPEPEPTEHVVTKRHELGVPPASNPLPAQATSQRRNKPPNYKLHVLTALSLAVAVRFLRYGTKAITG